jgi:hypothetical protein
MMMTEQEWLECADPQKMLEFLRGKASERKLRLFACAWCRSVWDLLVEDLFRAAVEAAERFADGLASRKDLAAAKKASGAALEGHGLAGVSGPAYCALACAWSTTRTPVASATLYPMWVFTEEAQRKLQASILRDLFGNPFRPVAVNPTWLAWNRGTVVKLAQDIYDQRDFDRLPILADALEEAGCTDADILTHCRGPGPHVRGCWPVDLALARSQQPGRRDYA